MTKEMLKAYISNRIYANSTGDISGSKMQEVLQMIVDECYGGGEGGSGILVFADEWSATYASQLPENRDVLCVYPDTPPVIAA
jgi:hypothetical protein